MPSLSVKPTSKEVKQKQSRGNFFDTIQRKFRSGLEDKKTGKSGWFKRFSKNKHSEKGANLSVSLAPSLEVSRSHSFARELRAQPLPLPVQLASVGHAVSYIRASSMESPLSDEYDSGKPAVSDAWGDLGTASISSSSTMDTNDQPDSRLFSPQASDYESGNATTMNSPSRLRDRSLLAARRQLQDEVKPVTLPSNNLTLRKRRPLSSQVTKLQIPPHTGFISASDSSIASPSRSPMTTCTQEHVNKSGFRVRRAISDMNSVGYIPCCSPESGQNSKHDSVGNMSPLCSQNKSTTGCTPIPSPRVNNPRWRSVIQSCSATPLHHCAGGRLDDEGPESHKLPLPPVSLYSSFSKNRGRGDRPRSASPVSRWKKGRLIGSGTFGHVYLGFNSENGEMCAMKEVTLFSDDLKSKECALQLGQEITLLSRLRHPNIVQYFGSETVDNKLYIYLEYISGGSIHKLLGDYGRLGESAIRSFTRQILTGLAYLHARNTVHRDIKGANILVDPNGRVKLADFGMAKHVTGQSGPLSFKGSPYWMAPEVIRNSKGSNLAVDIWSLGCTVIEMATAKPPWSQYEGVAALFKVGNSKEIPEIPDHLSKEGKDFLKRCLQRNPLDRPTAVQLLEHPFLKNVAPSGRGLLYSKPSEPLHEVAFASCNAVSGHMKKGADSNLDGVAVQLSRGAKFGSESSNPYISKHVSCPVSPISSPLLCTKSSQSTPRKRSPFFIPQTASGSCTPHNGTSESHLSHSTFRSHGTRTRRPQKSIDVGGNPIYRQSNIL